MMMPDLTPIATEYQLLQAYKAQAEVDALLTDQFTEYGYRVCACGATVEPPAAVCHACLTGNRRLDLYGRGIGHEYLTGSLTPTADVTADWSADPAPCAECAVLRVQVEALQAENSDLARQVVALRGHCEALAAQVWQGKGDPSA